MQKRDFYEVLGVSQSSTAEEIKRAYRKKALELHPDRNKAPDAETKFKEVNEAYQVLSDSTKRASYDQFGHAAFDPASGFGGSPFATGTQSGPFQWSYHSSGNPFAGAGQGFSDPFEVFEAFFGGNPFGMGGSGYRRKPRYVMRISFMEAAKGTEKKVEIDGKERTIKIPAGADDGTRIRFDEFDLTIEVEDDKTFRRDGFDLYIDLDLPLETAILGGQVKVPTLDKPLTLKIRPGTQPNTMVRLRNQGIQRLQRSGRGDQYVRLKVTIPEKLSKDQQQKLKQFADSLKR